MKLRLLPIFVTFIVTSAVLFGGWFVYQTVAKEDPLSNAIGNIDGVHNERIELSRNHATIEVTVDPGANLREVYQSIEKASEDVLGDREVTIKVVDQSSKPLDNLWAEALFDVAQAMELKQYSIIPQRLEKLAAEHKGLNAVTEMDEDNVYITLSEGENTKYVVLQRIPLTMGVWPNE